MSVHFQQATKPLHKHCVRSSARTSTPSRRYSQPRTSPGAVAATGRRARISAIAQGSFLTTPAGRRRSSQTTAASSTLSASASCGTVQACRARFTAPQRHQLGSSTELMLLRIEPARQLGAACQRIPIAHAQGREADRELGMATAPVRLSATWKRSCALAEPNLMLVAPAPAHLYRQPQRRRATAAAASRAAPSRRTSRQGSASHRPCAFK